MTLVLDGKSLLEILRKQRWHMLVKIHSGFEMFAPNKRVLPGDILPRQQELQSNDATLTLVSDEGSECRLSSIYLVSCGLRVRFERDFLHRLNNTHNNAVSSAGYSDVPAKAIFLSRVKNGSAGARNRKQELHQSAKTDGQGLSRNMRNHMSQGLNSLHWGWPSHL